MRAQQHFQRSEEDGAPDGPAPLAGVRIGVRLKHARMTAGLRLRDVAGRAGCSESLLSKVENEKAVPSLNVLRRISEALGMTLGQLFAGSNEPDRMVFKAGERPIFATDSPRGGAGLRLERLIPYGHGHLLQGNIHIVARGGGSEGTVEHSGEEAGYVLEGKIELIVGDRKYILEMGDSFCFRSELAHGYRNIGDGEARILFISTPPNY